MLNFYQYFKTPVLNNYNRYYDNIERLEELEYAEWGEIPVGSFDSILHILKRSPEYAYTYAGVALCGRWMEAEPYIMEDSEWFLYKRMWEI